jgi:hypothetical protein
MGPSFSDITIYAPTPYTVGTPEYLEETSLINFVSDLYVQHMDGYKPPNTNRITIQPAFHEIWNGPGKLGSIISIAPFFNYKQFASLDKAGKYKYILDLIQTATIQLSDEYQWEKAVFENAYRKTLNSCFRFKIIYPPKQSKDRKKSGAFVVQKTETVTSAYVEITTNGSTITKKLFEKNNAWWYDCVYNLARQNKWYDNNRFGIAFGKGKIDIWYSIDKNIVGLYENGRPVTEIDFKKYFLLN